MLNKAEIHKSHYPCVKWTNKEIWYILWSMLLNTTVSQTQWEFSSTILTWYISFRVTFRTSALGWIIWNFTKRGFVTGTEQHTSLVKKICAPKTKTIGSLEQTLKKVTNLKEKTQTFYLNRFKCLQSQCLISARIIYNTQLLW